MISYLKPNSCVQIIYITYEYLINRINNIGKQYWKLFNCMQTNKLLELI